MEKNSRQIDKETCKQTDKQANVQMNKQMEGISKELHFMGPRKTYIIPKS